MCRGQHIEQYFGAARQRLPESLAAVMTSGAQAAAKQHQHLQADTAGNSVVLVKALKLGLIRMDHCLGTLMRLRLVMKEKDRDCQT